MSITMDEEIKRWTGTAQIGAGSGGHPGQEEGDRPAGVNKKTVQRIFRSRAGRRTSGPWGIGRTSWRCPR